MSGGKAPGLAARRAAVDTLDGVLRDGKPATLPDVGLVPADRAHAEALVTAAFRYLESLDRVLDIYLTKRPPLRVLNILRIAATEMLVRKGADHAAVDLAVRLAADHAKTRHLKGLVNAVLRRVATEGPEAFGALEHARLALPIPFRQMLKRAHGKAAMQGIAALSLTDPPVDLTMKDPQTAPVLAKELDGTELPGGSVRCTASGQISRWPGFADGNWWVQNGAAALPARILDAKKGETVIDVCAAPGGKTLQLATMGADVTAVDVSSTRMRMLRENLERTGLSAKVEIADALTWTPPDPADAILLDAPCSATGTLRRHPELPYREGGFDLDALMVLQDALLSRVSCWLKPGGRLVYATCSLFPEEGEDRIAALLASDPGLALDPIDAASIHGPESWVRNGMIRTLPTDWAEIGGLDGFFIARLRRNA